MERWATVKRLHQAALECAASQRAAFLDEACGGDDALRREVESLLAYEPVASSFMEAPAVDIAAKSLHGRLDAPLVGQTLSHYHVESLLGAGGMGEVYLARDPRLERAVALKILPPDLALDADRMERFSREAKAASALNHPNVATIYDIGQSDALHFIAMEYVEGHTLAEQIAGGPLAVAKILDIAVQAADALDDAHAKGIIHRDIKPANLMVTPRGQVKVLDFGIAKTARSEAFVATQEVRTRAETAVGVVIGSAPYMSPEQVAGRVVDARSDLFSLGVTLYELATGRLPFAGATASETMAQIAHAEPAPIAAQNAGIPAALERIIFKCLEKRVERRYESARELLADLRHLQWSEVDLTRISIGHHWRHNLPAQLTSFVGRQREIEEVRRLLGASRLVTLTGAGGCGKTRLALQVASQLLEQFRDGVWVVDLSPLSEPRLVTHSVASVLKVQEGPNRPLLEGLCEYLQSRQILLVLDNCEHLIAACAQLAEMLLHTGAYVHILATSREALGLSGETLWRVPSLSLPEPSRPVPADVLLQYEAVRLFAERAGVVDASFTVTESNAATAAEVCRRLDGIPLAIELAAARLKVLTLDQISARLNDRFRLLTGGTRTALARQRTLEATVEWSYNLLSKTERRLFCRLSSFAGGWTLEAAEEVCSGGAIKKTQMLDLLSQLVDKSLVSVEDTAIGERRYRFLETVRQYGRERLLRSGEAGRIRDLHFDFFLALAQRAEPELIRASQAEWLTRLQFDHDNLRLALDWSLAQPNVGDRGLALAAALFWFWLKRGYLGEGRERLESALATGVTGPMLRAKLLIGLSHMTYFQGDYVNTQAHLEESLALGRQVNDLWVIAFSLFLQALVAIESGKHEWAVQLAMESQAAALASRDPWLQGLPLFVLAYAAEHEGDYDRAARLFEENLRLHRQSGDKFPLAITLGDLAQLRVLQGRHEDARELAAEGVLVCHEVGDVRGTAWCMASLAAAHAASDQPGRAARLWGVSDELLASIGAFLPPNYQGIRDRYFDDAKRALGEGAFMAAVSQGQAMSLTQAVQYALSETSDDRLPDDAARRDQAE